MWQTNRLTNRLTTLTLESLCDWKWISGMLGCPHGTWCYVKSDAQRALKVMFRQFIITPVWCHYQAIDILPAKFRQSLQKVIPAVCWHKNEFGVKKVMPEWHKNEFGLFQFVSGMLGCPHGAWCQFYHHQINGEYHFSVLPFHTNVGWWQHFSLRCLTQLTVNDSLKSMYLYTDPIAKLIPT